MQLLAVHNLLVRLQLYIMTVCMASYMSPPRIHFAGRFYYDASTINNERLNFLLSSVNSSAMKSTLNPNGTNSWAMIDCYVTSAVYRNEHGETITVASAKEDPVVGLPIVNNPDATFPKLVDLDPDVQTHAMIYGMGLGVNWDPTNNAQENAFVADFVPSVITNDIWERQIPSGDRAQQRFGARCSSRLENVRWSQTINSLVLKKLKEFCRGDGLSISFSVYNYSYTVPADDSLWLYGNIVGSIGVGKGEESLSFPENRVMNFVKDPPVPIPVDKPCHGAKQWMMTTYFDVIDAIMTVNFGNTFKMDLSGKICEIFPFFIGVLTKMANSQDVVEIISEVNLSQPAWYETSAGIQEFHLTDHQKQIIDNSKVVVVMLYPQPDHGSSSHVEQHYPICDSSETSTLADTCAYIILQENPCLVRPMSSYVFRLENADTAVVSIKYRYYGKVSANTSINLIEAGPNANPTNEDLQYNHTMKTNSDGIAVFQFVGGDVREPRKDVNIDGQVFTFRYCAETCPDNCYECDETNIGNLIAILVWSSITYQRPYFWNTQIQPILSQYQELYPAMSKILNLGDYDDVTRPQNVRLLNLSLSLDTTHPSHMPVTRDLSPTKREMILEWLNTEDHPRSWEDMEDKLYDIPPYCYDSIVVYQSGNAMDTIPAIEINPNDEDDVRPKSRNRKNTLTAFQIDQKFHNVAKRSPDLSTPLWADHTHSCTPDILKKYLQTAISLEFSTIPLYLTALYSIKDGYNKDVYSTIRSVVMQEMLHLAQAVNIMISIGGAPLIDSPDAVPASFPTHLPDHILPGLQLTLRKASPKHIAHVFMMIEFPDKVMNESAYHPLVDTLTIGNFYKSLRICMNKLYRTEQITFSREDKQLHWPWAMYDKTSHLYVVNSIETARAAIETIVEQGEGTEQRDPTYMDSSSGLSHFFKFGELACKHHLQTIHEHTYNFLGSEIQFVPEGVWPMRDNPSQKGTKGTHAYRETKLFHRMYRSLLKSLQVTFDGDPDMINEAVYIMESMQIQAKKLMQIECPAPEGHPKQTCGPVFDYHWQEL